MRHIETEQELPLSAFRKIAIGTWVHPRDPQTYAEVEFNVEPALRFLKEGREDRPLSITHFVTKVICDGFTRFPDMNSVILRGKLYRRKEISAFISTLLKHDHGADLSGFPIRNVDQLSLNDVAEICDSEVKRLRRGDDPEFHALNKNLSRVPMVLATPLFRIMDFFKYTLNLAFKAPGMKSDRFGSVIITNIGALGLQSGFPPLTAVSRTPFLAAIGKPFDGVVAIDGQPRVQKRIKIGFTFDHRYIDGYHGAKLMRRIVKVFEAPEKYPAVFNGALDRHQDSPPTTEPS